MIPRQARRADPCNSGSEGDGNGGDVGDVRGLSIMGVTMLAILLLFFAFAALSALVRLISRLLLLLVTLLLVGEVRVTALPLDHRELVGVLLIVTALAMGGCALCCARMASRTLVKVSVDCHGSSGPWLGVSFVQVILSLLDTFSCNRHDR
jgi:hypothetical protein